VQEVLRDERPGITASGKRVSHNNGRFVAADTAVLPFGKKLAIPGYHGGAPVEVLDTGSAIKGKRLDVYFPSHQTALEWGRRTVDVLVIE
jgi:3D (Asp-Asp-Asp) domain-containing protein